MLNETYEIMDSFVPGPGMSMEVYEEDLSYKAFCEDVRRRLDGKLPSMYEASRGYGPERVSLALDAVFDLDRVLKGRRIRTEDMAPVLKEDERVVFDRLRKKRAELAKEENVPAYRIFTNQALLRLAQIRPDSREELLGIPGIGAKTERKYGEAILQTLREEKPPVS